ncbi:hypothetical protein EWE74_01585 [Sphingobacterium corticibacterium]|uniref:IPT/TIG domain-containing protein n=2 Tax=Sphingobacterium corticibacterium TaxID=2484746 RepID=A0A4Q6XN06_9SPHI|nr:hypothetical protein EWE74_01585 [Sphingobacterium corticibacterium]
MENSRMKIFVNRIGLFALLVSVYLAGCRQDTKVEPVKDPVVTSYTPEAGRAGTEIVIQGENFGNEITDVKVWVNSLQAQVVSVVPTRIYAVVPTAAGSGAVKVSIREKEFELSSQFTFQFTRNVSTYSGSGTAVSVDGALRQASFNRPYWLAYDKKDDALFVLEEGRRVRRIKDGMVKTVASLSGSINNPRNITMSITCDTLFIGNDNAGNANNVSVAILTRDTDFSTQQNYVMSAPSNHVNFAGVHPLDGTLIFYCWPRKLYKWNKSTNRAELLYDLATVPGINGDFYANFAFSPDGTSMYVVAKYPFIGILRAAYSPFTNEIVGNFQRFAGTGSWGQSDGNGTNASFDQPAQVMVDTKGTLYIAEKFNHWIRTVSPSGDVLRYVGDGGPGNQGFADGQGGNAKFNEPEGIAMDKDGNIYVADLVNSRIRVIKDE